MKRQLSTHAAAAKMIRQEIKKLGVKAHVTSESYAGGSSVHVVLEDESPDTVKKIRAYAGKFKEGQFDGMTDSYNYSNMRDDIPQVKYVFVQCKYSEKLNQAAWEYLRSWLVCPRCRLRACYGDTPDSYAEASQKDPSLGKEIWPILTGTLGDFWTEYKAGDTWTGT